jgi:pimeloyl-ACP methyl ester carboxylesterase
MFADDLGALFKALGVHQAILCGLSLGGMIAQAFAMKYQPMLKALVLTDTAVSTSLTLNDKFQRYILFPKWMMIATIRWMGVERFTRYSFWLAKVTRSEAWLSRDAGTRSYLEDRMLGITKEEYLKIYDAIYEFEIVDLGTIAVPTLITIGEYESGSVYRHAEEMRRLIPGSQKKIVPGAGHTSNMEKPAEFNAILDEFLARLP